MTTTIHIISHEYQLDISTCLGFRDTLYISTKYGKFFTTIQMRLKFLVATKRFAAVVLLVSPEQRQSPVAARRD